MNALLDAIRARPDDDAPRLVYADALSEAGDPMGELIALQCRMARLDPGARAPLAARDLELRALVEARLPRVGPVVWERGFIVEISTTPRQFADVGDVIVDAAPLLERLVLGGGGETAGRDVPALAQAPALARIRGLELVMVHAGDPGARAIAASPFATRLESLRINIGMIRRAAPEILTSPQLARLRQLDLGRNYLDPEAFRTVRLPNLESLHLGATNAGDDGARAIGASGLAARELDLSSNRIGTGGVVGLARSPLRLRSLDLSSNRLGQMAAAVIARSDFFRQLERLSLQRNQIGDEGARALATSGNLANVRELDLRENRLTDAGRAELRLLLGNRVRC